MHYWQIRINIFLLRSIAPLSILYCILRVLHNALPLPFGIQSWRLPIPLEFWAFAEAASYIFLYLPYKYYLLQLPAHHPKALPCEDRKQLFARCLDTVTDPEQFIRGWFRGAEMHDIGRENVREFVHWAFFNAHQLSREEESEVESYLEMIESRLGSDLSPGMGSAVGLTPTLDTVHCTYRSSLWYMCVMVVDAITHCSMLKNGYQFYSTSVASFWTVFPFRILPLFSSHKSAAKHITYWYREHRSSERLPVLFIHGIGVGLYPYTNFLRDINIKNGYFGEMDDTVGVIAIEIMAVSSRLTYQALDKDVLVDEIKRILDWHGWSECVLVGHSYGTVISTHLLKSPSTAPLFGPVVLIDPICFLLHLPDVAYNFTARQPSHAKELVLWYFGSMDIGIAHTLGRRFFWSENILWKEDMEVEDGHHDMTVVLSAKDDIVDVTAVRQYLSGARIAENGRKCAIPQTKAMRSTDALSKTPKGEGGVLGDAFGLLTGRGLESVWLDGLHHAQLFDFKVTTDCLVKIVRTYIERGVGGQTD